MDENQLNASFSGFTNQEMRRFKIDDVKEQRSRKESRFPTDASERKEFIFNRTGYAADRKNLSSREWYCFNYSMNKGLDIGLSDRELKVLSLIDQALHTVPRFLGAPGIPRQCIDSTAAHSKQVMNTIQTVVDISGILKSVKGTEKEKLNTLRQDMLLGAWVHDMGEVIFELTTVDDVAAMSTTERIEIKKEKDRIEDKVFDFACQLAGACLDKGDPELFVKKIRQIRKAVLTSAPEDFAFTNDRPRINIIRSRMKKIEKALNAEMESPNFPKTHFPETLRLREIYDKTEGMHNTLPNTEDKRSATFLHAFVKTLESVEGLRYYERNGAVSELQELAQQLDVYHNQHLVKSLHSDHDIIESARRCENRLHLLLNTAHISAERTSPELQLARAAASYTYRSIARQFLPEPQDEVGITADIINRAPEQPSAKEQKLNPRKLQRIRAAEMEYKGQELGKQHPDSFDTSYITRKKIGAIYRAAEELVFSGDFIPHKITASDGKEKTASLISLKDTPVFPEKLVKRARIIEERFPVADLKSRPFSNKTITPNARYI